MYAVAFAIKAFTSSKLDIYLYIILLLLYVYGRVYLQTNQSDINGRSRQVYNSSNTLNGLRRSVVGNFIKKYQLNLIYIDVENDDDDDNGGGRYPSFAGCVIEA